MYILQYNSANNEIREFYPTLRRAYARLEALQSLTPQLIYFCIFECSIVDKN